MVKNRFLQNLNSIKFELINVLVSTFVFSSFTLMLEVSIVTRTLCLCWPESLVGKIWFNYKLNNCFIPICKLPDNFFELLHCNLANWVTLTFHNFHWTKKFASKCLFKMFFSCNDPCNHIKKVVIMKLK